MLHYNKEDVKLIFNTVSSLLSASAYVFLFPIIFVLLYNEPTIFLYLYVLLALVVRVFAKLLSFKSKVEVERRHAVVSIILFWIFFSLFASIPFIVLEGASFIDGFFEAVSAITSTGVSMFLGKSLMHSTLFWRSFLNWFSGIGIVVLAIMGLFMIYSKFKLFAESEGHSEKIGSSVKKTISIFVGIYGVFTIIGIILLRISGLPLFDSIYYTFTSISLTGTSMNSVGLLGYNSIWALIVVLFLLLAGGTSFITHYRVYSKRSLWEYFKDKNILFYIFITTFFFIFVMLKFSKLLPLHTLFYVISAETGGATLFTNAVHKTFPELVKGIMIFLMFVGGSTVSTAGGIKIQRLGIILKSIWWKVKAMLLPKNAVFRRRFNGQNITDRVTLEVMGYVLMYVLFVLFSTFVLMALGYHAINALFEVTSIQGGIGISTGIVSTSMPLIAKIILIINMFVGRLEIMPVLVLFGFLFNIRLRKH